MNFPEFFGMALSLGLMLWAVKVSAKFAYKKEVSWEEALMQGIVLIFIIFVISLLLSAMRIKSLF
ncbi:MAG: hypothetical protein N3F05_04790 [Candidatus Diapherotrites archaeon]|nr:hypothetical protein [Candidatus Diapherotrites archaeon]